MNRLTLITVIAVLIFSVPPVFAVDEHHPDKPEGPVKATPSKDTKTPADKQTGMPMGMMQDSMLKMHEQMHKIMQTEDGEPHGHDAETMEQMQKH